MNPHDPDLDITFTDAEKAAVTDPFADPKAFVSLWCKAGALAVAHVRKEATEQGRDLYGAHGGRLCIRKPDGQIEYVDRFER